MVLCRSRDLSPSYQFLGGESHPCVCRSAPPWRQRRLCQRDCRRTDGRQDLDATALVSLGAQAPPHAHAAECTRAHAHSHTHVLAHTVSHTCMCLGELPGIAERGVGPWLPRAPWCWQITAVRWPLRQPCPWLWAGGPGVETTPPSCKGAVGWQVSTASMQWRLPLPARGGQLASRGWVCPPRSQGLATATVTVPWASPVSPIRPLSFRQPGRTAPLEDKRLTSERHQGPWQCSP